MEGLGSPFSPGLSAEFLVPANSPSPRHRRERKRRPRQNTMMVDEYGLSDQRQSGKQRKRFLGTSSPSNNEYEGFSKSIRFENDSDYGDDSNPEVGSSFEEYDFEGRPPSYRQTKSKDTMTNYFSKAISQRKKPRVMGSPKAIRKKRKLPPMKPTSILEESAEKYFDKSIRNVDPAGQAEERVMQLISRREKVLKWCRICADEHERAGLAKKLQAYSEQVLDAIRLWQQLRGGDGNGEFAWNGHASYEMKMCGDTLELSQQFNLSEDNFLPPGMVKHRESQLNLRMNHRPESRGQFSRPSTGSLPLSRDGQRPGSKHSFFRPFGEGDYVQDYRDRMRTSGLDSVDALLSGNATMYDADNDPSRDERRRALMALDVNFKRAVVELQRRHRAHLGRIHRKRVLAMVCILQAAARMFLARIRVRKRRRARAEIARLRQRRLARQQTEERASVVLQCAERARQARVALARLIHEQRATISVTKIASHFRCARARRSFGKVRSACVTLQSAERCRQAKRTRAALVIQTRLFRMMQARNLLLELRKSQQAYLVWLLDDAGLVVRTQRAKRRDAAQVLVRFIRAVALKRRHSATSVQCTWRMSKPRSEYIALQRTALCVQTWRRSLVSQRQLQVLRSERHVFVASRLQFLLENSSARRICSFVRAGVARRNRCAALLTRFLRRCCTRRNHAAALITRFFRHVRVLCVQARNHAARVITKAIRLRGAIRVQAARSITSALRRYVLRRNKSAARITRMLRSYIATRHNAAALLAFTLRQWMQRRHRAALVVCNAIRLLIAYREKMATRLARYWRCHYQSRMRASRVVAAALRRSGRVQRGWRLLCIRRIQRVARKRLREKHYAALVVVGAVRRKTEVKRRRHVRERNLAARRVTQVVRVMGIRRNRQARMLCNALRTRAAQLRGQHHAALLVTGSVRYAGLQRRIYARNQAAKTITRAVRKRRAQRHQAAMVVTAALRRRRAQRHAAAFLVVACVRRHIFQRNVAARKLVAVLRSYIVTRHQAARLLTNALRAHVLKRHGASVVVSKFIRLVCAKRHVAARRITALVRSRIAQRHAAALRVTASLRRRAAQRNVASRRIVRALVSYVAKRHRAAHKLTRALRRNMQRQADRRNECARALTRVIRRRALQRNQAATVITCFFRMVAFKHLLGLHRAAKKVTMAIAFKGTQRNRAARVITQAVRYKIIYRQNQAARKITHSLQTYIHRRHKSATLITRAVRFRGVQRHRASRKITQGLRRYIVKRNQAARIVAKFMRRRGVFVDTAARKITAAVRAVVLQRKRQSATRLQCMVRVKIAHRQVNKRRQQYRLDLELRQEQLDSMQAVQPLACRSNSAPNMRQDLRLLAIKYKVVEKKANEGKFRCKYEETFHYNRLRYYAYPENL